ncbi:uncharacterized protein PITG_12530 [Phytophthora infestans T30-4]|uniref:Uncharacterized protein n=1 Tax=Phytophthora infestans (strain T30-4) TaxID=403677 RepID=D0NKR6_PHYIT|nr:uncharacterized protein PITG_12530 [Phytophthora infestans T30-4]EEY60202.1 conserved hypothetical protein [Phytophthora infestans T30-4]|eukprot:XP_002900409.1 conserved hypothetical protein [Phytophthora infestans T30-4]
MPQSLVFAEQVPTYVFQNVNFQATVKLVDSHKTKVTGVRKPLQVSLRFHDTYDLVEDQDAVLRVTAEAHIDPNTGLALLSMSLHTLTATCDGRNFCLEVRSGDADIESVFSSPVNVVKEKLQVVTQPPDVWFKDEGGREKCMTVALNLVPAPGAYLEDRVVPLDVKLLYESGNTVLNQSILRLFPDMRPNMTHGRATVSFRIDDVSKNHQGQSFMLEIGPEQQDGSSMFQDIAPTRTSVIAIRSKRNKRKLNAQAAAAAAVAASGAYGMRASPRSVAGTPRTPYMNMGGTQSSPQSVGPNGMMIEPHPQRARKYLATSNAMGYNGMMQQPQQPMGSMSWSSHLMQPTASSASPPMQAQTPQSQQAPAQTPGSGAANSPGAVEWALGGFEIHPDGSMNTARPIYRCPQCRRLNDVDMLAAGPAVSHSPQCVFSPSGGNGNMMYRSQMEGTPMNQQQMQQQRGYAPYQQMAQQSMGMSAPPTSTTTNSYGSSAMVDSSSLNVQQNTVNITSKPEDVSPKTLATYAASSTQRPSMTIFPYMNKVTTEAGLPASNGQEQPSSGNLFESNAFHNQMEMIGNGTEKLFMNKNTAVEDDPALDPQQQQPQNYQQDAGANFGGVIGTSLFNEMTSMGINLDQSEPQLLGEFGGIQGNNTQTPNDEDQVFYILAQMYTDAQERKLGLPAFDQFQRMLGFYSEAQDDVQTQVVFHPLRDVCLSNEEREKITTQFVDELGRDSQAVHSLPKYQHNLIMLREDALMFYWSQSLV